MIEEHTSNDNVVVKVYDLENLIERYPKWDQYSNKEKLHRANEIEPVQEDRKHNITCTGLDQAIVDDLDKERSGTKGATHLGVGNGTATPGSTGTALGTEAARVDVSDTVDEGGSLLTSTYIDKATANGGTLREVGLFTADSGGLMLNHATISPVAKDQTTAVTVDIELRFSR